MKLLIALLAAAGLSGCVGYGGGVYGTTDIHYSNEPYYSSSPYHGYYGHSVYGAQPRHQGYRDRDRDGVPNRIDRDRDGDGVPNRRDRAPNNPRRN